MKTPEQRADAPPGIDLAALAGVTMRRFWLTFPKELEARFEAVCGATRKRRLHINGLCSLLAFNLFLLVDWPVLGSNLWWSALIRLTVATPVMLAGQLLLLRTDSKVARELTGSIVSSVMALSPLLIYRGPAVVVIAGHMALVVIAVVGLAITRLRVPYAFGQAIVLMLGDLGFSLGTHVLGAWDRVLFGTLAFAGVLFSFLFNFQLELDERTNYLAALREQSKTEQLARANEELERISQLDPLTGVANRRYFNRRLSLSWQQSLAEQSPVCVIMVDLDHFKELNDHFGHSYGDRVLIRLAQALENGVRREIDTVTRYGGDEFSLILPRTPLESGLETAARLLKKIGQIAAEEPRRHPAAKFSASLGVASAVAVSGQSPEELVDAADESMYRAKALGRNRVCASVAPTHSNE